MFLPIFLMYLIGVAFFIWDLLLKSVCVDRFLVVVCSGVDSVIAGFYVYVFIL
jgi:hypothetical protein